MTTRLDLVHVTTTDMDGSLALYTEVRARHRHVDVPVTRLVYRVTTRL